MSWNIDSWVIPSIVTVGTTPVKVLDKEALRAGYRISSLPTNLGVIYHRYSSSFPAATYNLDSILPGGVLEDTGPWQTIHHGEVWLASNLADQTVQVERIVCTQKPPGWEKRKWWQVSPW